MKSESLIQASWFYVDDIEKCKFNWFLYEFAIKLFDRIDGSGKKALVEWRERRGDIYVAGFCAYFPKRMRQDIFGFIAGHISGNLMDEDFVRDYCHDNTRGENKAIIKVCGEAWIELLESCSICPVACLEDTSAYCEFFDRMERGGYLS